MFKKVIVALMVLVSASFGMSLSKLNSAGKEELMQINGIGEVKAAAIMKERRKGKFKSFEDLSSRVEGVGEQTAANIKNDIKVGEKVKKVKKTKKSSAKKSTKKKTESKKSKTVKKETSKKEKAKKAEEELKKNKKKVKKEKAKKSKKSKKSKKAKKAA